MLQVVVGLVSAFQTCIFQSDLRTTSTQMSILALDQLWSSEATLLTALDTFGTLVVASIVVAAWPRVPAAWHTLAVVSSVKRDGNEAQKLVKPTNTCGAIGTLRDYGWFTMTQRSFWANKESTSKCKQWSRVRIFHEQFCFYFSWGNRADLLRFEVHDVERSAILFGESSMTSALVNAQSGNRLRGLYKTQG